MKSLNENCRRILISKHFYLDEFTKSETAKKLGIDNSIKDSRHLENLSNLVYFILEPARKEIQRPIKITSGYRVPELNKAVEGVANSQHMIGSAADLQINNEQDGNILFDILSKNDHVDTLLYEKSKNTKWIHVSCSRNPRHIIRKDYFV